MNFFRDSHLTTAQKFVCCSEISLAGSFQKYTYLEGSKALCGHFHIFNRQKNTCFSCHVFILHQKPKYKEKMRIKLKQTFVLLHIAASAVRTGTLIAKYLITCRVAKS